MTAISAGERAKALANPLFMFDLHGVVLGGGIQVLCLLTIIAISIIKPWGRRDLHKEDPSSKVKAVSEL